MKACEVYGKGTDAANARYIKLKSLFSDLYGGEGAAYSSSGRAEILGNHTDHNHGEVITAAVGCDILAVAAPRKEKVRFTSEGFPQIEIDLGDLGAKDDERGTSAALVRGVLRAIKDRGYTFEGFDAVANSTVFKGAGVSSSAAFEVLIAEIINDMYLGGALTAVDKAIIAQYAENEYFGKPCGLLDQCGIAVGALSHIDFFDPSRPKIEKLLPPKGLTLVITDTGGDHAHLTAHYAAVREEMGEVAKLFGKKVLRDISSEEFYASLPSLMGKASDRAILRAMHFYAENERVRRAAEAVKTGDDEEFMRCVDGSGLSSLVRLQNCSVPGETSQPVVLALEAARNILGKNGAVRVHGGGFAGSVLAVVKEAEAPSFAREMAKLFGESRVFIAEIRPAGTTKVEF